MKLRFFEKSPLYIFLIAIYPVLFLLSVNISEVSITAALRSGILFLLAGSLLFFFMLLFTKNAQRSAFYALIVLLVFFLIFFVGYAPAYRALRSVEFAGTVLGRHRILVPATAGLMLITAICLLVFGKRLAGKVLNNISLFANFIALLLTLLPVITILSTTIKNNQEIAQSSSNLPLLEPLHEGTANQPDIYYIIMDMHTNDNVLKKLMDYDNSAFTKALQDRGFFVSQCSQSNYDKTQPSLTSSLNLDYLQTLGLETNAKGLYPVLQQSRVRRMLENAGYSTYSFASGYSFVELRDADHYSAPSSDAIDILTYPGVTSFESLILSISAGQILYENRTELSKKMQVIIDAPYTLRRAEILNVLDSLPEIAKQNGPKFIYAHMLAPHDPFVFDENGDPSYRRTPFVQNADPEFGAGYGWNSYKGPYVDEVIYLQKRTLDVVDQIIQESETPPIIILQGDHGIPRTRVYGAGFQIFNAYYFPGVAQTGLYDQVSPVNSFRLLFNDYFGTNYSLLPDLSYSANKTVLTLSNAVYPCP